MAKKSIGSLHADVTANASQFISEFKRADNESRRSAAAINGQVDKLTKDLKKKFQLADFGKDILRGAGLFGGMQIAQEAAAQIVGYWERAANSAKEIEASSERALAATLKGIAARQDDAGQLATMQKEYERMAVRLADMNAPKFTDVSYIGREGERRTTRTQVSETNEQAVERAKLSADLNEQGAKIAELTKKIEAKNAAEKAALSASDATRRTAALSAGLKEQEDAFSALIDTQKKANEESAKTNAEAQKLADKYRDLADPMREYKQNLAEIATLEASGKLLYDDAWKAKVEIWAKMAEAANKSTDRSHLSDLKEISPDQLKAADDAMRGIQLNALETERIVGRAADGMADAWVDSLRGVEGAWSNLADSIINEILRVVAQLLIVKPIINSLGGVFSGLGWGTLGAAFTGYGGGKAMGGGVDAGVTYRVNESGQEFFKSNTGGTIIPAGISSSMTAKAGGGGATYFIDATGADAGKIAQLENTIRSLNGSIEHRAVGAVIAAKRRGGGTALALA